MKNYINRKGINGRGGQPELHVEGERTVPLWFALSDIPASRAWTPYAQKNITNFAGSNVNIVAVDSEIHSGWKENGEYEPTNPLKEIEYAVKANPNAKVVIRLHLNPPYWWMRKYPDELVGYYNVKTTDCGTYGDRVIGTDKIDTEIHVSFVSEKWYEDCAVILKKLCKTILGSQYKENFLGIQVAYGRNGEWIPYGKGVDAGDGAGDYGKAMLAFFRKYLREKYKTVEALQAAYKTDETFENVRLATPTERWDFTGGGLQEERFFSPDTNMRAIDTAICVNRSITTAISALAKPIKEVDKNILVGAFYGYFFGSYCGSTSSEEHALYEDENIDFLASPAAYLSNKHCGNGYMLSYLPESMRLNGKLYLCEMDQGYKCHGRYRDSYGAFYECESEEEYAVVLKRNIMENILRGHGAWYYDHRLATDSLYEKIGYWDKECRLQTIAKLQSVCKKMQEKPFVKSTDVLVVFSEENYKYLRRSDFYYTYNHLDYMDALAKSGVGYDLVYLNDLKKVELSRYKCVLFMHCQAMTKENYDFIKTQVMTGGRTVGFIYKCGYIVDGEFSMDNVKNLIGISGLSGYVEKETEACRVFYKATPPTDRYFYTEQFKRAGAHIYTDSGEVVVADNEMVMVHSKGILHTTLHLPCGDIEIDNGSFNTVVYDIKTGERVL